MMYVSLIRIIKWIYMYVRTNMELFLIQTHTRLTDSGSCLRQAVFLLCPHLTSHTHTHLVYSVFTQLSLWERDKRLIKPQETGELDK